MNKRTMITTGAVVAVAVLTSAGCSSSASKAPAGGGTSASVTASASSSAPALTGSITVLAAASLTGSFTTIGQQFEAAHSGVKVTFSFGASSALATQIGQGVPADVFASAAPANMATVVSAGQAASSTDFVQNSMEIAVPPTNPAAVTQLSDLAKPTVKVALCQAQVPCGATALKVFTNAKITVTPVTQAADVKSTLSVVELGEADAAVVYVTDVLAAGAKVKGISIPDDVNATTEYPIATLKASTNPTLAAAFVSYVESSAGQAVLTKAGFAKP